MFSVLSHSFFILYFYIKATFLNYGLLASCRSVSHDFPVQQTSLRQSCGTLALLSSVFTSVSPLTSVCRISLLHPAYFHFIVFLLSKIECHSFPPPHPSTSDHIEFPEGFLISCSYPLSLKKIAWHKTSTPYILL